MPSYRCLFMAILFFALLPWQSKAQLQVEADLAPSVSLPGPLLRLYGLPLAVDWRTALSVLDKRHALPGRVDLILAPAPPLGIFCKWENQIIEAARLPVKFRLGEVQYVERLEGKGPAY